MLLCPISCRLRGETEPEINNTPKKPYQEKHLSNVKISYFNRYSWVNSWGEGNHTGDKGFCESFGKLNPLGSQNFKKAHLPLFR